MKEYLSLSNRFLGMLGECYCKEYMNQQNMAYTSTESIHKTKIVNDKLEFRFGYKRINITIPKKLQSEIQTISKPSNSRSEPYFIYDFLAYRLKSDRSSEYIDKSDMKNFVWIEAKSGNSKPSQNQHNAKLETQLLVKVCRAEGVLKNRPENVGIELSTL